MLCFDDIVFIDSNNDQHNVTRKERHSFHSVYRSP